ncbi:glycine/D-amino acid oxidase-like deaminating enzyme [Aliiruegeria haliotis]|uniref:Glycine/D-amino acid oxidase-like deaminating enzyme n=1 Tax=Aliiruegeria haliotis TaxID=1280846 RepID=A0A2T0RYP5_9RHOB|nr:FAD-binding oxidoreductase [Aliiruegeria haliotis]PRY26153.1 glycine/D-amino acid oxidase-like deaminating enzyme [Aliiruegeria haliotis]
MKRIYESFAYEDGPLQSGFWPTTMDARPDWPEARGDLTCDYLVIGGGYTGLTAALDLAEAGADVALLEAETPGWGASGRNGGFCCLGGAKIGHAALVRKFGESDARCFADAQREAVLQVRDTLDRFGIEADTHSEGETLLAHRASDLPTLRNVAREVRALHGATCEQLSKDELAGQGMASGEFHGAVTTPIGFALNPLKYATGLALAARDAGARIFGASAALALEETANGWSARTPKGKIRARKLLLATNGYSSDDLPDWLAGRYLPVQSNVLVTRPLTEAERAAQGWTSHQMCYDTRTLLHYFRLMPDGRMLFGIRGAMRATAEAQAAFHQTARTDFDRIFPEWRHVETPHFWSGLLAMSRNLTPYVGSLGSHANGFAAMCYHGNGVAMGSYAGGLLADLALGRAPRRPFPALMRAPMGRFPLGRFRRAVLPVVYRWYQWADRG